MRNIQTTTLLFIALLGMQITAARAQSEEVTIQGRVIGSDGSPLKDVMVLVSSAMPKQGSTTQSTREHVGCGKLATTDAEGKFQISGLDAELNYKLALSANGFQGALTDFEPDADGGFQVELGKISAEQKKRIKGRVVDSDGRPVRCAVITPRHISYGRTTTGVNNGLVTRLVLTDDLGEFELFAKEEVTGVSIRASTSGFAMSEVQFAFDSDSACEIKLGKGASIRGRLIFDGQPVAGVKLGLVQEDRTIGFITTPLEVATDEAGIFSFNHLPPDREYTLCTLLQQDAKYVLPVSLVSAPADGKRAELGDVAASLPNRLSIKIRTEEGQPLPEDSVVFVSRSRAWQAGRFQPAGLVDPLLEIADAPAETYEITLRVPGYTVSRSVPLRSPDINRRYRLTVDGDTSIAFLLVKSK